MVELRASSSMCFPESVVNRKERAGRSRRWPHERALPKGLIEKGFVHHRRRIKTAGRAGLHFSRPHSVVRNPCRTTNGGSVSCVKMQLVMRGPAFRPPLDRGARSPSSAWVKYWHRLPHYES
jgi:hypothetical protein